MLIHTPAPWKVTDDVDETAWVSSDARENVICDIVGSIWDPEAKATQITGEDIANAYLIAAAPDMLEALSVARVALKLRIEKDATLGELQALEMIEGAIAKAKGEVMEHGNG